MYVYIYIYIYENIMPAYMNIYEHMYAHCSGQASTMTAASSLHSSRDSQLLRRRNPRSSRLPAAGKAATRLHKDSNDPPVATPKARSTPRSVGRCTNVPKRWRPGIKSAASIRTPS